MDDVGVDVVELEIFQALGEVDDDVLRPVVRVPELALDEELVARDDALGDALLDRRADLGLVVVVVRRVDVAVAGLDGGLNEEAWLMCARDF